MSTDSKENKRPAVMVSLFIDATALLCSSWKPLVAVCEAASPSSVCKKKKKHARVNMSLMSGGRITAPSDALKEERNILGNGINGHLFYTIFG